MIMIAVAGMCAGKYVMLDMVLETYRYLCADGLGWWYLCAGRTCQGAYTGAPNTGGELSG